MKTILIACETIEDEIKAALERLNLDHPVVWLEGGLHNNPDRLRDRVQRVLDEAEGQCELLIFTLGYCGGGVSELTTGNYTTVLPLADDCLSILLGSLPARKAASDPVTYFLTEGWMRHENNVVTSYDQMVAKYGQDRADRINKMMMKHYQRFGLVNTGTYDLDVAASKVDHLAKMMDMSIEPLPGDNGWLDTLLTGPHDDPSKFLVLPPHSLLNFDQWCAILEQISSTGVQH